MNESVSYQPVENKKRGETIINFFGEHVLLPALDYLSNKVEGFEITTEGLENLNVMKDRPCLVVSNHLKPTSALAGNSQLSPDAFVLQHVIEQNIGTNPKIVAKAGTGWWFKNTFLRAIQEKTMPVIKKTMSAAGMIPVDKNPGAVNIEFFREVEKSIAQGDSLIIFPEGHWYSDFESSHSLSDGAALLAIKYGLTLIPAYIRGADKWEKGTPVSVSFGEPFLANNEKGADSRHQTTEKIRSAISRLQSKFVK